MYSFRRHINQTRSSLSSVLSTWIRSVQCCEPISVLGFVEKSLFFALEDTLGPRRVQKHSFLMRGISRESFFFRKKTCRNYVTRIAYTIKQKVRHLAPFSRRRFVLFNVANKLICLVLLKSHFLFIYYTF